MVMKRVKWSNKYKYIVYDGDLYVGSLYPRMSGGWLFCPAMSSDPCIGKTRREAVSKGYTPMSFGG